MVQSLYGNSDKKLRRKISGVCVDTIFDILKNDFAWFSNNIAAREASILQTLPLARLIYSSWTFVTICSNISSHSLNIFLLKYLQANENLNIEDLEIKLGSRTQKDDKNQTMA